MGNMLGFKMIGEIGRTGEALVEWRIPNFPSLLDRSDGFYMSPAVIIDDECWRFMMDLNSKKKGRTTGWVRLDLVRHDRGPPATFCFSVGIRGSGGVEMIREGEKRFKSFDHCSWDDFCLRSDLVEHRTSLMPDDTLTVSCVLMKPGAAGGVLSLLHSSSQVAPTNRSQSCDKQDACTQTDCNVEAEVLAGVEQSAVKSGVGEVLKSLQGLLAGSDDSDCLVKVRGKEFRAHRAILRARSPVFRAMFAHESGTVTMKDCDPQTIPDFLEHVYTGSVEMISDGNVFSLYATAEKYDLPTLKRACAEFMKKNLTIASFCDTILLAIKYDEEELVESATEFFCRNTLEIVQTPEWQIFLSENATIGNELYIKQLRK